MESLSHQQYQKVLQFMETSNQDNFQTALQLLRTHNFSIETAMHNIHQPAPQPHPQIPNPNNQRRDQEIVRRYIQFINNNKPNWSLFGFLFRGISNLFGGIFRTMAELLLPQSLILKFFRSQFYRLYSNHIKLMFREQSLLNLLKNTKVKDRKSVMVVVSGRQTHPQLVQLFNRDEIIANIQNHFHFAGYLMDNPQLLVIDQMLNIPQIIVCRMNIFDEVVVVDRFVGEEIVGLTGQKLNKCYLKGKNLMKRDRNVLIKYRNYVNRLYGYVLIEEEEEEADIEQEQENRIQINRQNQLYKLMEKEQQKKKQQEYKKQTLQKQKKHEKMQEQEIRQIRKMSIPAQPKQGDIIRINFRCPDGSTLIRNFSNDQKVELLFNWVQLNDKIQFQNPVHSFEIMYSYPPRPLSECKDKQLSQVFESEYENVLIHEL